MVANGQELLPGQKSTVETVLVDVVHSDPQVFRIGMVLCAVPRSNTICAHIPDAAGCRTRREP